MATKRNGSPLMRLRKGVNGREAKTITIQEEAFPFRLSGRGMRRAREMGAGTTFPGPVQALARLVASVGKVLRPIMQDPAVVAFFKGDGKKAASLAGFPDGMDPGVEHFAIAIATGHLDDIAGVITGDLLDDTYAVLWWGLLDDKEMKIGFEELTDIILPQELPMLLVQAWSVVGNAFGGVLSRDTPDVTSDGRSIAKENATAGN